MLVDDSFTENFNANVPMEISGTSKTISTTVSVGEFINYY